MEASREGSTSPLNNVEMQDDHVTDWKPVDSGGRPRSAAIRTLAFDDASVDLIAETLGVSAGLADFRLPSSRVWQVTIPGEGDRPMAMLTLWPGVRRVDAVNGAATVVFSSVATVDIVPGVEVQFRRTDRAVLIVARSGKIIVRA